MVDGIGARRNLEAIFKMIPLQVPHLDVGLIAVPFDLACPDWCRRMFRKRVSDVVKTALLATGTRIEYKDFHALRGPFPIPDFRQVVSMLADVLFVLNELVAQELFEVCAYALQARDAVDDVARQVKSIQIV